MGWIKLHTKFLEWEWADDPNMVSLFIHLLLMANYKECEWHGIKIERGQFVTSLSKLSAKTGISIQTLRTCLNRLQSTQEITSKLTNKYRIITICKYDKYQVVEQVTNKQTNKQVTSNQQATNNQLTTAIEYKNNRNIDIKEKERDKEKEKPLAQSFFDDAKLIQEMFTHSYMIQNFCRELGITEAQCRMYAESILNEWQLTGKTHYNLTDSRSHMLRTIRCRVQKDQESAKKNGKTREERERELANHMMQTLIEINNATNNIQ